MNSLLNNLPGLRQTLPIKYDNNGQPILQNQGRSTASKFLENMVLPGTVTEEVDNPLTEEAMRLDGETGEKIAFVPTANKKDIAVNGEKPSKEDFAEYSKTLGNHNYKAAQGLINSTEYKNMNDANKNKALQEVYSFAKALSKGDFTDYDIATEQTFKKAYAVYEEKGYEGVANYYALNVQKDADNGVDIYDVVSKSSMSTEDKGYYLRAFDSPSTVSAVSKLVDIQHDYGYEGLYDWYTMKANKLAGDETNTAKVMAIETMNLSKEEKGYYLSKWIQMSEEAQDVYYNQGYEGVYNYYYDKAMSAENQAKYMEKKIESYRSKKTVDEMTKKIDAYRSSKNSNSKQLQDMTSRIDAYRNRQTK